MYENAAAVHIDIVVFLFSRQYNRSKKGVCFYEIPEIFIETDFKIDCTSGAVRSEPDLALLVGIGLVVYAALFLFVLFQEIGERLKENLHDFIFS